MTIIVNLSAIHTLYPITSVMEHFSELCDKYSQSRCCPSWFTKGSNYAWVMAVYKWHENSLIKPYKLGQLSTSDFLEKMLKIFDFLLSADLSRESKRLFDKREQFLTSKLDGLDDKKEVEDDKGQETIAKCLIEEAWNSIADFTRDDIYKLEKLIATGEEIFIVTNSNELNIFKLFQQMKELCPHIKWYKEFRVDKSTGIISLSDRLKLAPSFTCHAFKADAPLGTPTIFQKLLKDMPSDSIDEPVRIISQYEKDIEAAKQFGVPQNNCFTGSQFFQMPSFRAKLKSV